MRPQQRLDRLARAARRFHEAVLEADPSLTSATTSGELRRCAYDGVVEEPVFAQYVAMVRQHAHRVTDADITRLRVHGCARPDPLDRAQPAVPGDARLPEPGREPGRGGS
ncbi:hypothetical protein, partial [Nocardia salmonicida]|uniref:hypothetical protein n=1 Tax=Nocardia salmonicida TaxID=53431 RepID=UPI0033CF3ED5